MRNLITMAMLFATCAIFAQTTKVGFSSGAFEQSNELGIGVPIEVSLSQEVHDGFGVLAAYSYIWTRRDDINQVRMEGFYEYAIDHSMSVRGRAGVATQFEDAEYFSFGFDILARASDDIQVGFMWSPVVRGEFRDINAGWSHTVTVGLLIEL